MSTAAIFATHYHVVEIRTNCGLSTYFNIVYVTNYIYIAFVLAVNEFWIDLFGTNVLGTCYHDTVRYWLLMHFIKPIVTVLILNCCRRHKCCCCACSKICLLSFCNLLIDIALGALSTYYCWLDLFYIYYEGNEHCNIAAPHPYQMDGGYSYSFSSLIFLILSFIFIHFTFIWLETFRFVEIVVFQAHKSKLKRRKNSSNAAPSQLHPPPPHPHHKHEHEYNQYIAVPVNDNSRSVDDPSKEASPAFPADVDLPAEHCAHMGAQPPFDESVWIDSLFIYGMDDAQAHAHLQPMDDIGGGQPYRSGIPQYNHPETSSLSNFWRATTDIVTAGFILTLTADDFCCVCWGEFEVGEEIAKLHCGHIYHKQCAKEWFEESETCPVCRVSMKKTDGDDDDE